MHVGGNFQKVGVESRRRFIELGGLRPDEHVLDIGCGVGRIAIPLLEYLDSSATYEGFDVDAQMIAWAQRNITRRRPSFRFRHADLETDMYNPQGSSSSERFRFPYDDASFSFVIATSVFTHLYPAEIGNYIRETRRVLAPGGRLYSTWFLIREKETDPAPDRVFVARSGYWTARPDDDRQAIGISMDSALAMLGDAGLEIAAVHDGRWSGRVGALGARQDNVLARAG